MATTTIEIKSTEHGNIHMVVRISTEERSQRFSVIERYKGSAAYNLRLQIEAAEEAACMFAPRSAKRVSAFYSEAKSATYRIWSDWLDSGGEE